MSETAILEQTATAQPEPQEQVVTATPQVSQIVGDSLWGMQTTPYQNPEQAQTQETAQTATETQAAIAEHADAEEVLDVNDYFKREFGLDASEFKSKWEEYNKPKEPVQPQEQKWVYDDSKEDEIYNYINQKRQLDRLEKYDVADANQAAEIIRTNLQFKYKDLSTQEIDRLFTRQYSMPPQPQQTDLQTDEEYAAVMDQWKQQVQEKQQDMIIDAKLAKPELSQYKSQIVLPEIQKPQVQQTGPTPEELAAMEAGRQAYLGAVESNYQNFKGFNVTAKDGDVQLPISYGINPEELNASKQSLQDFNVTDFFAKRWFDEQGNPKVTLMQEDLYSLSNRDKIHQKIANEAAAQMKAHLIKNQNNINLKGVSPTLGPTDPTKAAPKNESQALAESIWNM
jgi:hypothetical protein